MPYTTDCLSLYYGHLIDHELIHELQRIWIAMPPLSRWFVRTALAYFVAALLVGVGLALRPVLNLPTAVAA